MGWPDLSRWIWSYVISRLKLFTDLDPSKLELSGRSLSVANVEIDKARVTFPGVVITQFIVEKLTVELTSSGIAIGASGVNIGAFVKSLEPPDLAISRILEQTRTDMEGYGGGDMSGMKSRFADFALSQVKMHITDVRATLRYPSSDVLMRVHVDQIVMNQKHVIEFESIIVTRGVCDSESDDSYSSSSDSESDSDAGSKDATVGEEDEDELAHNKMAQSVFFSKRGSLVENSSLVKSVYFDAEEGAKHGGSEDEEELGNINRVVLKFSMDPLEVFLDIDCIRLDGILALRTIVDTLNLVWKSVPSQDGSKQSVKSELSIATFDIYETMSNTTGAHVSLTDIGLQDGKLDVGGLDIPGVVTVSPLLTAYVEDEKLVVDMTLPVSVSLSLDSMPYARDLATRIGDILSELITPPDPRPTPIHVNLPEFRLAIGQNFTLLVFPEALSNAGFTLREILLTASEGQLLIRNLKCEIVENGDGFKNKLDELRVRLSSDFVDELHSIGLLLSGASSPKQNLATSREPWAALEMANTYWKVDTLLIEDSRQVLMRGDMELRTVGFNADLRASLDLDHERSKTAFELSAYSTDGLKSIESTFSVFDCDIFLEKYIAKDASILSSPTVDLSGRNSQPPSSVPEIRSKLDFGNGIRVHFPDTHESVFMISLDITEIFVASDGNVSLIIPELFVKLEDSGDDIPLLKMQETKVSHFPTAASGPETSIAIKKAALATCPDTYSLLTKLPAVVIPPALAPHFDVDPDTSVDVFKDVVETSFTPEKLSKPPEEDLAVTLDSIDIKEDYMIDRPDTGASEAANPGADSGTRAITTQLGNTKVCLTIKLAQWQMFDGFDLERTREAIGQAINRIETAVADINESDKDTDEDESDRMLVGDFMYNSLFVVAQGGPNSKVLSTQVADELGGTGAEGYARSTEPKLTLTLRRVELKQELFSESRSLLSISVRDGKVSDTVPTSAFSHLLAPIEAGKQKFLVYTQDTIGSNLSPELRVSFALQPLHVQLDQDTVEFLNRFFQFDVSDEIAEAAVAERNASSIATFIQRFEFSELPLVIDYTPKKVDYKSLRSGAAAELVNLFVVKGAKLTLRPCLLHGISGWDRLLLELSGLWGPDIRANQLSGLLSGIWPVRKALKLGEGIKSWAIVPMRSKRTGKVTRGAGLLVRRTMDELLRLRTAWLDSTDRALGGETDSPEDAVASAPAEMLTGTAASAADETVAHRRDSPERTEEDKPPSTAATSRDLGDVGAVDDPIQGSPV